MEIKRQEKKQKRKKNNSNNNNNNKKKGYKQTGEQNRAIHYILSVFWLVDQKKLHLKIVKKEKLLYIQKYN